MTNKNDIEHLFKAHYAQMYRLAVALLHNDDLARDIVHNVFASLLDGKSDTVITESYLLKAVRNRCINQIRDCEIHNRISQRYYLDNNPLIIRNADEKAYSYRITANARKVIGGKHSLMIGADGGAWRNELEYTGTNQYLDKFQHSFAGAQIGYNFKSTMIYFNSDFGISWDKSDINGKTMTDIYPFIHIYFQYTLSRKHRLSSFFQYATNCPEISQKASDILKSNEYLYITGNPYLKNSRHVTLNLSYSWFASNVFNLSLFGQYYRDYNRLITIYSPYGDGRAVIRDYTNDGDNTQAFIGVSANANLFDGKLQLNAGPCQYFYNSTGLYNVKYNPFTLNADAKLYLGNFYLAGYYMLPYNYMYANSGMIF